MFLLVVLLLVIPDGRHAWAAETQKHYYGHAAVEDKYGVIAPWYKGQNGQYDFRVRIAAETLKRYPWTTSERAVASAPEYVYNGTWSIDHEGRISAVPEADWANGDLSQRAVYILSGMMDYYRYAGDPAALAAITAMADYLVDHCQTAPSHGWPNFLISVPTMGTRYGDCKLGPDDDLRSGNGKIQLDIVAQVGLELVRAYQMTGNLRWYGAAKRWADLLAQNRNRDRGLAPWGRYANNASGSGMNGVQTGGISIILAFFDELIRTGYTGTANSLMAARDAGREYLRDVLLPAWTISDTWGRNFWDWEAPVQDLFGTEYTVVYLMNQRDYFTNWKNDVRNILSLFLNHAGVSPRSNGDVYHGAWAYPESSSCCDRSLWYSPMELASAFARYGVEADSEWARELARRSQLLATYDILADGQSMDLIDGGSYVNRTWFKIAHPMALKYVLSTMAWLPEVMGANRENHIMRTASVLKAVIYGKDRISYTTFDAPVNNVDVLRVAYSPSSITANGKTLDLRSDLTAVGYTVRRLSGGDQIISIRHDGATELVISGPDPQAIIDDKELVFSQDWHGSSDQNDVGGSSRVAAKTGAAVSLRFSGNQIRVVGRADQTGGLADVYLDDFRQLVPIDCYSPVALHSQILYYKNGLPEGPHTLRIVARGTRNSLSKGNEVFVDAVQYSAATGDSGFGEGGGSTEAQRIILGYTNRSDYIDSKGNRWRPGAEFVARAGHQTDSVARTWWPMRQAVFIQNTLDQELYRYGVHASDFTVNLTVGPGTYYVRLKFAETQFEAPNKRAITLYINDQKVAEGVDVFATAGGSNKAVDLVYNKIQPKNGVIEIRFLGNAIQACSKEAMVQAIEVGPGEGGTGATAKTVPIF